MKNQYFVNYSTPKAMLNELDETTLLTQTMFWAHAIDKMLCYESFKVTSNSGAVYERLKERLEAYAQRYGISKPAYKWAASVAELYERAEEEGNSFRYPGFEKVRIDIPEDEFAKLLKTRRSIRAFTGEPVDRRQIEKILEYASWAPNSCNCQALRYSIVSRPEVKKTINRNSMKGELAGCIIAVIADLRFYSDYDIECPAHDAGAAIQNMLLACHFYGLGACYVSDLSFCDSPEYRMLFKTFEYEKITAFVYVGHYHKAPPVPLRFDVKEFTRWDD